MPLVQLDKVPVEKQIGLLKKIISNVKTIGEIYNNSETNLLIQVNELKAVAGK